MSVGNASQICSPSAADYSVYTTFLLVLNYDLRRVGIPISYNNDFHLCLRIRNDSALVVTVISVCESCWFVLMECMHISVLRDVLATVLSDGIDVVSNTFHTPFGEVCWVQREINAKGAPNRFVALQKAGP